MNGGEGGHTVREMGYSLSEFAQVLPAAMRDWTVSGGPDVWQVSDQAGLPVAAIATQAQSVRALGALRIPVLRVEIVLLCTSLALAEEFSRRFERGFHRGGG
ncbi:MAG: hypothetical protein R3E46_16730 [Sedimenticolaceae bacterium]